MSSLTGGCQCGAVRFRAGALGRASICHCRMCQKAFASFVGPLVTATDVVWTRGAPKHYRSSNMVRRGFCAECGTQLTYEWDRAEIELAIGAFDDPTVAAPLIQVNTIDKLPFFDSLHNLPVQPPADGTERIGVVIGYQHPDHDTAVWPPEERAE